MSDSISNSKETNMMRNILRNELVWFGTFVIAIWGFVQTIVLPVQEMQINLARIQVDIADIKTNANSFDSRITALSDRVIVLEQSNLNKK